MTDGSDGSTSGESGAPASTSTYSGPTKDEVQSWVREVLQEMTPGDDLDKPATLRDVEARAKAITEDAMKVLRENPPTPPARPSGTGSDGEGGEDSSTASGGANAGGESSPQNPRGWQETVRKFLGFDV